MNLGLLFDMKRLFLLCVMVFAMSTVEGKIEDTLFRIKESLNHITMKDLLPADAMNQFEPYKPQFKKFAKSNWLKESNPSLCHRDLDLLKKMWILGDKKALQMLDLNAKPPSGIFLGNVRWPGSYDECLTLEINRNQILKKWNDTGLILGRFCTLNVVFKGKYEIEMGICVPNTCNNEDLKNHPYIDMSSGDMSYINQSKKDPGHSYTIDCHPDSHDWNIYSQLGLLVLGFFGGLVLLSTLYDLMFGTTLELPFATVKEDLEDKDKVYGDRMQVPMLRHEGRRNRLLNIQRCFSIVRNWDSLFTMQTQEGHIKCLDGIRVLSVMWVTFNHSHGYCISFLTNPVEILDPFENYTSFSILKRGSLPVDSFLFVSGFLLCYLVQKSNHTMKIVDIGRAIVYRFIRMTPPHAALIVFMGTLWIHCGQGPFWNKGFFDMVVSCQNNWFYALFYMNNYYKTKEACVAWTWYLGCDFQCFILGSFFMLFLKNKQPSKRRFGIMGIIILMVLSWIISMYRSIDKNYTVLFKDMTLDTGYTQRTYAQYHDMYMKTQYRVDSYLIGILFGYFLFNMKLKKFELQLTKPKITALWALSLVSLYGIIFVPDMMEFNTVESALFTTFSKSFWSLNLAWIVFACVTENGGIINKFLSSGYWVPLSRLSYCIFLVQSFVILFFFGNLRGTYYYTYSFLNILYLGFLPIIFCLALILTLTFEIPFFKLLKQK